MKSSRNNTKNMVIVANKQQVQEYYGSEALGQSALKKLLGNISDFGKKEDSTQEHFVIGSAVDCILTGEEGEFESQYYVSKVEKKPADKMLIILNHVHERLLEDYAEYLNVVEPVQFKGDHFEVTQDTLEEVPEQTTFVEFVSTLENWQAYIIEGCEIAEWNKAWGVDAKMRNVVVWNDYFLDLCRAFGKQVLDATQSQTVQNIVNSLRTNPRTGKFFDREMYAPLTNVDVYYQLPIYFEYRGVQCKALLDMAVVVRDLESKILSVQGIDLKTMNGNTFQFASSMRQRRYDIQAAWYTLALSIEFGVKEPGIMEPFLFVVESTSYQGKPLCFQVSDELLQIGQNGRPALNLIDTDFFKPTPELQPLQDMLLVREIQGYEQLLDKYIYHNENGWSEEREIRETPVDTPLLLTWEGIASLN